MSYKTQTLLIDDLSATLNTWSSLRPSYASQVPLHFAHANGFPSACYRQMLEKLSQQRTVYALDHRATWVNAPSQPPTSFSWHDAARDIVRAIEQIAPQGVVGVGHSLGAVTTLLAAAQRPDLFRQIILIEPVMLSTRVSVALACLPMKWRMNLLPIAKRTLQRREQWDSHNAFISYHASKAAFDGISSGVMQDYARHGLRPYGAQFELVFPKHWEAHIFRSAAYSWQALTSLNVPCVVARAEKSRWVADALWRKWQRRRPDCPVYVLPKLGHMAPLQNPNVTADWIVSMLMP